MIPVYQPTVRIPENMLWGIADKKIGNRVNFMVDYQVIEKTKSYIVLRVNSAFFDDNKRIS